MQTCNPARNPVGEFAANTSEAPVRELSEIRPDAQSLPITKHLWQLMGRIDPSAPFVACALGVVGMGILVTSLLLAGKLMGKKMGQLFLA